MAAFSVNDYNQIVDDVNAVVTSGSGNCSPVAGVSHAGNEVIQVHHFKDLQDAISSYASSQESCPGISWEVPLDLLKQAIIDEIYSNLALLDGCTCNCCHPDDEGHGDFEILATGPIVAHDETYVETSGEVNFGHVVVGHAFSVPTFQTAGGQLVSDLFAPFVEPGSASSGFILSIEVHRISDDTWVGATITQSCTCGVCSSTGTAEVPFSVYSNFAGGSPPGDYDNFRLTLIQSNSDDLCGDCTDDPQPHCGGGG